jgi:MMP 1-O-methyltransferase
MPITKSVPRRLTPLKRLARPALSAWRHLAGFRAASRFAEGTAQLPPIVTLLRLRRYLRLSAGIPGWTRGAEAWALALVCHSLPAGAMVVEIGSFLGSSAVLLAGSRQLRGSGTVHCVDPFDASGDSFSRELYHEISSSIEVPLRQRFEQNIRDAGLDGWVSVHQGRAEDICRGWKSPIDLLYLDGDHSWEAVQAAYNGWAPFLRQYGVIAIHSSLAQEKDHDGLRRLAREVIQPPAYAAGCRVGSITFARKLAAASGGGSGTDPLHHGGTAGRRGRVVT